MSAEQKPVLRRIRTFAQDAATAQGKGKDINTKDNSTSATKVAEPVIVSTEKAQAAKVFANQTPTTEPKSTKPTVVATTLPEHLPAFHELQKKVLPHEIKMSTAHTTSKIPTIQAEPPKKVTVRTKKRDLNQKISAGGGTIITDTKRNKVNFFGSLVDSINSWFSSFNKKLSAKKTPTYTVTDVERRKGVIQKATSKSGSIFTADNDTLREEIRRRNQIATAAPHALDITWTPQTEPGFALLEENDYALIQSPVVPPPTPVVVPSLKPERVVVEFKKKSLPEPVFTQPSTPEPVIVPEIPKEITPVAKPFIQNSVSGYDSYVEPAPPERKVAPIIIPETPKETPPPVAKFTVPSTVSGYDSYVEPAPLEEKVIPIVPIAPKEQIINKPVVEAAKPPHLPLSKEALRKKFVQLLNTIRFNTNELTLGIVGSIIAIVIVIFIAKTLVGAIMPNQKGTAVTTTASLLASSTVSDLSLPMLSQETLLEKLKEVEVIDGKPKETRLAGSTGIPLSTSETLKLIGLANNKNFIQTASEAHVLTINAQHGLLVKITDPTAALGSLLSSETQLAENLHVYLGFTTPNTPTTFSDATIATHDVRVLTSEGKEIIVYGFISSNTILITEDTTSFQAILGSK